VYAGTITMSSIPYPDSVIVEVTINDTGGVLPFCGWLTITRNGAGTPFYIERQVGTTVMRRFVDTNVSHNTLYCYEMALAAGPFTPCPFGNLCDVFDCFYQIMTCVNTGPEPALIGHGLLSRYFPDGSSVDDNEVRALLYPCATTNNFIALHAVPSDAAQYMDAGNGVDVFGAWWCCWAQGVWLLAAQVVTPHSCTIAVDHTTWGRVKALYGK
jgi:hypothetical protein